MLITHTANSDN